MAEYLFTKQVEAETGIPAATLRYWRCVDQGPPSWKRGRRVVYERSELDRWLAEQKAATVRGGQAAVG